MKNFKLQSAMEYLMTYGWAILIIAVVMVALFSLGIIGGTGNLPTQCTAPSGYQCTTPVLSHTSGNVIVTVGQTTGTNWATANFFYVPQGTSSNNGVPTDIGTQGSLAAGATVVTVGGISTGAYGNGEAMGPLSSGQTNTIQLGVVAPAGVNVGGSEAGQIWVAYTTSTGGASNVYYAQVGTITLKAV